VEVGGFSLQAKQAIRLAGQIPTWIAGKMAACLQITATDFAYRLKSFATQAKQELKNQMQAAVVQAGVEATLKCAAFEILQIIQKSVQMLRETTVQENLVLAAARRNCILAWRPDMKAKKLVDCSVQEWCKDLPECGVSHRLHSSWVTDRMKWLDADGVPVEPDWSSCTLAKTVEDMRDFDAVASALDVLPVGEDDLQGPSTKVGGAEFETIQVLLPLFGSVEDSMEQDVCRAAYLQLKPR